MARAIDWQGVSRDGLAWDNTVEFPSLEAPELASEKERLGSELSAMEACVEELRSAPSPGARLQSARKLARFEDALLGPLNGLLYLAYIEIAVDATCEAAHTLAGEAEALLARLRQGSLVLDRWLASASEHERGVLTEADSAGYLTAAVQWRSARVGEQSIEEQGHVERLKAHGPLAWERLYKTLVGTAACPVRDSDGEHTLGLAAVRLRMQGAERAGREAAWRGMVEGWRPHRPAAAVALNGLLGWWNDTQSRRYPSEGGNPLHSALLQARMSAETWRRVQQSAEGARPLMHRALKLCARGLGVERLAPWDLKAPPPLQLNETPPIPLGEGLATMADAFGAVLPAMGEFVGEAVTQGWIDARQGEHRRPGGLVAGLWRSKEPRIFINWGGQPVAMRIAAHEMGHGFHFSQAMATFRCFEDFSWALLEVPSNFAELSLGQYLIDTAPTPESYLGHLWQDVLFASHMLTTSSFGLDLSLALAARRQQRWLTVEDLDRITEEVWTHWFGDVVQPFDSHRWVNDHHLYLANTRHTGFLYQFSWFAAMGLLRRAQLMGPVDFGARYCRFLQELHAGDVEGLMWKHFEVDVAECSFWEGALNKVEERVDQLESCLTDETSGASTPR